VLFVKRADFLFQSWTCLARPFLIEDRAAAGAGIYSAGDWSRIRREQTAPLGTGEDRYASDDAYRRYLVSIHQSKILAVESLLRSFDFRRYRRIMELGCGDMPQAFTVSSRHPEIAYTATDFDADVIGQCGRLPLLSGIRKAVFDVVRDDLDELRNADLVLSWSLEFSLDDGPLMALFAACAKLGRPYLLCTHTDIGPIGYLARTRVESKLKKSSHGHLRRIGWLRSTGEIARLARQAGMALRSRAYHVNHATLLFTPR
jgi:hypothetical protein